MTEKKQPAPLPPDQLYTRCAVQQFAFSTTQELADITGMLGQERAADAVRFGIGIVRKGYNLFIMGPPGSGKHTMVHKFLEEQAKAGKTPDDWCYVNNFAQPHKPNALRLPAGMGIRLQQGLAELIDDLRSAIPAAFESDEYQARVEGLEEELKHRQENAIEQIRDDAEKQDIKLLRTSDGFVFAPVRDGTILGPEEFKRLREDEQRRIEEIIEDLQERLKKVLELMPVLSRETREKIKELNRETARLAVSHLIDELRDSYRELPEVLHYLDGLQEDLLDNINEFRKREDLAQTLLGQTGRRPSILNRYRANLLVDHSKGEGIPVIHEDQPTYPNLVGRVEHISQMGTLITDYSLIKAGALHYANGGYLILDAAKILTQPFAWEGLKRALRSERVHIDSIGQLLSMISTVSLEPEPIPLEVKVVLLGDRLLYYLLDAYDPEFAELFKVVADFEDDINRNPDTTLLFARFIATVARKDGLQPLERDAVGRVIEYAARICGDAMRLTTHMRTIVDLMGESDYWARQAGHATVTLTDVEYAIEQLKKRNSRVMEQIQDEIIRDTLRIDTSGARIAQVNGLSVITLGTHSFGQPTRITATTRVGEGQVIDIEREVELGGPIHSKGVLILASFIGERYSRDRPLSLHASLVFEQSYGRIEGDSASLAELCALLSSMAQMPVEQSLAITGSVNQHGEAQAIGGVNEKIEGFFDICKKRGLTGKQGVIIPQDNVKHLMLRKDVVAAARDGQFHIYPVMHVDEAIGLLCGMPAGARDAGGNFPEGSFNDRVEERLIELAAIRHTYGELLKDHHSGQD